MGRSRTSVQRELYGILGDIPNSGAMRSAWHKYFTEQNIDGCLTKYPTTIETLPERLSEMFHFDRRLYIVGEDLQEAILPLLDELDESVIEGRVNVVKNKGGVFIGLWIDDVQNSSLSLLTTSLDSV